MTTTRCVRAGWLMGALGVCVLLVGAARADETTERPGSILIFPKVVSEGSRTTVIQITNTSNSMDQVLCFYLDGRRGLNQQPLCTETDFSLTLTKQQPTHWDVTTGRSTSPFAGLPPGLIPPVPAGFTGALICTETDAYGSTVPVMRNALKGEATLFGPGPDVSKYNGIAFVGRNNGTDGVLDLDGTEYNACSATSRVNFINPLVTDPVVRAQGNWGACTNGLACNGDIACAGVCTALVCVGGGKAGQACTTAADCLDTCSDGVCSGSNTPCTIASSSCGLGSVCTPVAGVVTAVTVLPCNLDFNSGVSTNLALTLTGTDGLENTFSGSKTMSCWESFTLDSSPACFSSGGYGHACLSGTLATDTATVNITSGSGGPFIAVAEAVHADGNGNFASAATNTHGGGICTGVCGPTSTNAGVPCDTNSDCLGTGVQICLGSAQGGDTCTSSAECGGGACTLLPAQIILPGA